MKAKDVHKRIDILTLKAYSQVPEVNPVSDIKTMLKSQTIKSEIDKIVTKSTLKIYLKAWRCETKEELQLKMRTSNIYPKAVNFIVID